MTANTKSMLLLALTLITGFALGLFADASLVRDRRARIRELRRPPGFVAHMEDVIEPHSDAQRDSIRPILERVARQNNQTIRDVNDQLRSALDSMRTTLAPMLDPAQQDRLAAEVRRMPDAVGRGGRGGPPPFGGPGRPGRGGPPDGRPDDRPPPRDPPPGPRAD
jgi:uncharacterized membrane protein